MQSENDTVKMGPPSPPRPPQPRSFPTDCPELLKGPITIIYHRDLDGSVAAWAVLTGLARQGVDVDRNVRFHDVEHGEPIPGVPGENKIIIVDFSYSRETLRTLRERHSLVLVLDHHKTAEQELYGLSDVVFDMKRCGAHIAWDFFNPGEPLPTLIKYVESHDLWKRDMPLHTEVLAYLKLQPLTAPGIWGEFVGKMSDPVGLATCQNIGRLVNQVQNLEISETITQQVPGIERAKHILVNISNPRIISETLHALLNDISDPPEIAIGYRFECQAGKMRMIVRLRSKVSGPDVSKIAKFWGGGGHEHSAGFECSPCLLPFFLEHGVIL